MKLTKILVALVILGLIGSCKEEKKSDVISQMKQVMNMHDEVMPKMGAMAKLAGQLSNKEDSTEMGMKYKTARRDLQAARDSMMQWMQDFANKFDTDEVMKGKELSAQKQIWLDEEEERMKAVRDQINSSIEKAENLLNSNQE